jgi:hypothetical protein
MRSEAAKTLKSYSRKEQKLSKKRADYLLRKAIRVAEKNKFLTKNRRVDGI